MMARLSILSILTQMCPPKPGFTDKDLSDLHGKVYIVTGANTGIGKELARLLYSKHAKVYIGARSEDKANKAIEEIKKATPESKGKLVFLQLDLSDLTKVKTSAENFLASETKLHVLFNNAGIMGPPQGSKSAQGYELHIGVNNVGTFLFTKLLTPILTSTAKIETPNTVRVIWVASSAAELLSPPGGVPLDNLDYHQEKNTNYKYGVSKAGNYLHAVEFAKRYKADGIISVPLNPGNLHTELLRTQATLTQLIIQYILQYPPVYGAYTELFAAMSPKITIENSGVWVVPWGRFMALRKDLVDATKTEAEGGTGIGLKFWQWTEDQVNPFI